jgi:hypothetical protein
MNLPHRLLMQKSSKTAIATTIVCSMLLMLLCFPNDFTGLCQAGESAGSTSIETDLANAKVLFSKGKLQDARNTLASAEQKIKSGSADAASLTSRIRKLGDRITAKEDSLVAVNLEILRTQGAEPAFQYMQDVVWAHGISREKLDNIENTILNEAPAVNQTQERDDLAYAVKQLETNAPLDPSIDPYIRKTAEMLVQARADSIKRAEQAGIAQPGAAQTPSTPDPVIEEKQQVHPPELLEPKPVKKPVITAEPPAPVPPVAPPEEPAAVPEATPPAVEPPAPVVNAVTPPPKKVTPAPAKPKKPEEYTSPALLARAEATRQALKKLKANQVIAQNNVVELYNMLENGQGPAAMKLFRDQRPFISKYISPQVFNVLELTLAQSMIDAQKGGAVVAVRVSAPQTPEQTTIDRLDALMRQNKVEAAYREFTREEQSLKLYMSKKEFKLLKNMIEESYSLRTGIKPKKK